MEDRTIQLHLGFGAVAVALLLIVIVIPTWVSSPSNVSNIVLSPLFWPNTLAGLTGLIGMGLIVTAYWKPPPAAEPSDVDDRVAAWLRLLGVAGVMVACVFAMPRLGLVWTAMGVFAATAFLVHTNHRVTALICAVLVPLVLYAFFAHVAGVAIPQGNFVRLP